MVCTSSSALHILSQRWLIRTINIKEMIPKCFSGTWILNIMMLTANKESNRVIISQNNVYTFVITK